MMAATRSRSCADALVCSKTSARCSAVRCSTAAHNPSASPNWYWTTPQVAPICLAIRFADTAPGSPVANAFSAASSMFLRVASPRRFATPLFFPFASRNSPIPPLSSPLFTAISPSSFFYRPIGPSPFFPLVSPLVSPPKPSFAFGERRGCQTQTLFFGLWFFLVVWLENLYQTTFISMFDFSVLIVCVSMLQMLQI